MAEVKMSLNGKQKPVSTDDFLKAVDAGASIDEDLDMELNGKVKAVPRSKVLIALDAGARVVGPATYQQTVEDPGDMSEVDDGGMTPVRTPFSSDLPAPPPLRGSQPASFQSMTGNRIPEALADAGTGFTRWGTLGLDDVVAGAGAALGTVGQDVYAEPGPGETQARLMSPGEAAGEAFKQAGQERRELVDEAAARSPTAYKLGAAGGGLLALAPASLMAAPGKALATRLAPKSALAPLIGAGLIPGVVGSVGMGDPEDAADVVGETALGVATAGAAPYLTPLIGKAAGGVSQAVKTVAGKAVDKVKPFAESITSHLFPDAAGPLKVATPGAIDRTTLSALMPGASRAQSQAAQEVAGVLAQPSSKVVDSTLKKTFLPQVVGEPDPGLIEMGYRSILADYWNAAAKQGLSKEGVENMAKNVVNVGREAASKLPKMQASTDRLVGAINEKTAVNTQQTMNYIMKSAIETLNREGAATSPATAAAMKNLTDMNKALVSSTAKGGYMTLRQAVGHIRNLDDQIINASSDAERRALALVRDHLQDLSQEAINRGGARQGDAAVLLQQALDNERAAAFAQYAAGIKRETPTGIIAGLPAGQSAVGVVSALRDVLPALLYKVRAGAPAGQAVVQADVARRGVDVTGQAVQDAVSRADFRMPDVRMPDFRMPGGSSSGMRSTTPQFQAQVKSTAGDMKTSDLEQSAHRWLAPLMEPVPGIKALEAKQAASRETKATVKPGLSPGERSAQAALEADDADNLDALARMMVEAETPESSQQMADFVLKVKAKDPYEFENLREMLPPDAQELVDLASDGIEMTADELAEAQMPKGDVDLEEDMPMGDVDLAELAKKNRRR